MRIGIREQLGIVVFFASSIPLLVLSLAIWFNNYDFLRNIKRQDLALTASLKAEQIASNLLLIQATCETIVTRVILQDTLRNFYAEGAATDWTAAMGDIEGALASGGLSALLQSVVYSGNETTQPYGLLNATAIGRDFLIPGPFDSNGTQYMLGSPGLGYPSTLYPNITYIDGSPVVFGDYPLNASAKLLLGPLQINNSYALVSLTLPIIDNQNQSIVLGFMTVVAAATSLINVIQSREGLGDTGILAIIGPSRRENLFEYAFRPATTSYEPDPDQLKQATVRYVFPPVSSGRPDRHAEYNANLSNSGSSNFTQGAFPPIVKGFGSRSSAVNNASGVMSTHNENGEHVSVGFARVKSSLADWLVIIEQSHSEAWSPIYHLRTIILACAFGTLGLIIVIIMPLAHYGAGPIRRLRDATKRSVASHSYSSDDSTRRSEHEDSDIGATTAQISVRSKWKALLYRLGLLGRRRRRRTKTEKTSRDKRRAFRIPGKVPDGSHLIKDELTDLTEKFNEMTDELLYQYTSLEEKVQLRTQELEISKKAAEAANESKTLFIANISHELKTPLNGILGMCAVCMGEEDLTRIKHSLEIVYKSGDLLLNLLNDLLTFSKNQIGQQLSLEEREFRLADIRELVRSIFRKQAEEGKINFRVHLLNMNGNGTQSTDKLSEDALPAFGPYSVGRLKDMCLWGDQHRILQVLINLVSNSLKFTPEGGKVEVRIKCLGEVESLPDNSRNSLHSKESSVKGSHLRHRNGSTSSQTSRRPSSQRPSLSGLPPKTAGTALLINPMDPKTTPRVQVRERSPTPPPANAKTLMFEFEVEDSGPGIPEHLQQQVFEPFVQGDLGLSKKYGGTGLGLSICSQLAGLMGGTIDLVSTEGAGTMFNMKIPLKFVKELATSMSGSEICGSRPASILAKEEVIISGAITEETSLPGAVSIATNISVGFAKDPQPRLVGLSQPFFASTPSPSSKDTPNTPKEQLVILDRVEEDVKGPRRIRVLVAEDNLVNQEVVLRMLKLEDIYDVIIARDGQEAYDMVKDSMERGPYFNLILMDIQMPNVDGIQSTKLIRQMGYSAPIVALTAFAEESNVKECYDSGMDMFLSKPIRRPALKQMLKKFATIPEEAEGSPTNGKATKPGESKRELEKGLTPNVKALD